MEVTEKIPENKNWEKIAALQNQTTRSQNVSYDFKRIPEYSNKYKGYKGHSVTSTTPLECQNFVSGVPAPYISIFMQADNSKATSIKFPFAGKEKVFCPTFFTTTSDRKYEEFSFSTFFRALQEVSNYRSVNVEFFEKDKITTISGIPLDQRDIHVWLRFLNISREVARSGGTLSLKEVIKYISNGRNQKKPIYLQTWFSLEKIQNNKIGVYKGTEVSVIPKNLFSIRVKDESLHKEKEILNSLELAYSSAINAKELLSLLDNFEIVFKGYGMYQIELESYNLQTGKTSGHQFSYPLPISPEEIPIDQIRGFALLHLLDSGTDREVVINREAFAAACGSINSESGKPSSKMVEKRKERIEFLANIFGSIELTSQNIKINYLKGERIKNSQTVGEKQSNGRDQMILCIATVRKMSPLIE